jgi:hypothetical protein
MSPLSDRSKKIRRLTAAALEQILKYKGEIEKETDTEDLIPVLDAGGRTWPGLQPIPPGRKNDSPPSLGFGLRSEINPEWLQVIDGVEIVFEFDEEERIELQNATLDFQNGKFIYIKNDK